MVVKEARRKIVHPAISPGLRAYIAHTIHEILNDPDFGLELRPEFRKRLLDLKKKREGSASFGEVKRKYL